MSSKGYETEQSIAESLRRLSSFDQKKRFGLLNIGFWKFQIDPESVCTNLVTRVAGKALSENDINLVFRRSSWIGRKMDHLMPIKFVENVAIQSKDYARGVPYKKVLTDVINALMTYQVGFNLQTNTVIVTKDKNSSLLEAKLKRKYKVPVITVDELNDEYEEIRIVGGNSLSMKVYEEGVGWKGKRIKIGESGIIKRGHWFWQGLRLINVYEVDLISEETYPLVSDALSAISTYLNPKYYLYIATSGLEPKAERFLERVNGQLISISELESIISAGDFFQEFKPLRYNPFGIGKAIQGKTEADLYDAIEDEGINPSSLEKAINYFLTKHKRLRF